MKIILAPHLDDEVIGCYSILDKVDVIAYMTIDYRRAAIENDSRYVHHLQFNWDALNVADTIYAPSRFDFHPEHNRARTLALRTSATVWFYSIEMNVPWLELETDPDGKRALIERLYPLELLRLRSEKYVLFKSIKPYDQRAYAVITFERETFHRWPEAPEGSFLASRHRHMMKFQVEIEQFTDHRDIEYINAKRSIAQLANEIEWYEGWSCETFARVLLRQLQAEYSGRDIRIRIMEDGENGVYLR